MIISSANTANSNLKDNIRKNQYRFPLKSEEPFYRGGGIFPPVNPKFHISRGAKIFTIGSCFARNIEEVLVSSGFNVPVARFTLEGREINVQPNHILNEYNAGTTMQRMENVAGVFSYTDEMGIEETADGFLDLFLHINALPVSYDRLIRRRNDISSLYKEMLSSDVVILTMGLVEAWYDTKFNCYLNKAPSKKFIREDENRFQFHRLDIADVIDRMSKSVEIMLEMGVGNIVLTVSPVPLEATFMADGAVQANCYSKSVLRIAADALCRKYGERVDYYPSYEIVLSHGCSGFRDDNTHVRDELVAEVTRYMVDSYVV